MSLDISTYFSDESFFPIDKLCKIKNFKKYAFQIILVFKRLLQNSPFINWNFYLERIFIYFYPIIYNVTDGLRYIRFKYQDLTFYDFGSTTTIKNICLIFNYIIEKNTTNSLKSDFKAFNLKYYNRLEICRFNKQLAQFMIKNNLMVVNDTICNIFHNFTKNTNNMLYK